MLICFYQIKALFMRSCDLFGFCDGGCLGKRQYSHLLTALEQSTTNGTRSVGIRSGATRPTYLHPLTKTPPNRSVLVDFLSRPPRVVVY